jgi:predicted O-methyltransferase YrrM
MTVDRRISEEFINKVWQAVLGRLPNQVDLEFLISAIESGRDPMAYFIEIYGSPEATSKRATGVSAPLFVPPGHYYSPVVDPVALQGSSFQKQRRHDQLLGLSINLEGMKTMFHKLIEAKADFDFPMEPSPEFRYYWNNDMYSLGDATLLAGFIRSLQPARIIEVGSGFSSSVMLDTIDRTPGFVPSLTFIEPYTDRLNGLLNETDRSRVSIIQSGVQEVSPILFESLEANDILFLDTTHISKTGSDVNFELFEVLPRLKPGVVVHFHDVFDGFEYPDQWIFDQNRSWNELYLLRGFLMYNQKFRVIFANHAFAVHHTTLIREVKPELIDRPGGGLWLQKQ